MNGVIEDTGDESLSVAHISYIGERFCQDYSNGRSVQNVFSNTRQIASETAPTASAFNFFMYQYEAIHDNAVIHLCLQYRQNVATWESIDLD